MHVLSQDDLDLNRAPAIDLFKETPENHGDEVTGVEDIQADQDVDGMTFTLLQLPANAIEG